MSLTDAPFEHVLLSSAVLRFDKVTAHVTNDDQSGFVTLYEGPPIEIDLAPLRNGLTAPLIVAELPSGTWGQLRLYVASGELVLENGNVYSTDDGSFQLPSASSSGLKVFFDPPLEVTAGADNDVLIDFDLANSFHPIPANDPENAIRYQMHPVLRSGDCVHGGGVGGGTFSGADGVPDSPLADATVFILPDGESDLAEAVATTASDSDGDWLVTCLPIGEYDVRARRGELESPVADVLVSPGRTAGVDVVLE